MIRFHVSSPVALSGLLLMLSGSGGCEPEGATSFPVKKIATASGAIINGTPDTSEAHQAVVYLYMDNPEPEKRSACSGTVISADTVLTAAHCLIGFNPIDVTVAFGNDVRSATSIVGVQSLQIHPAYDGNTKAHDIALVKLSGSLPGGVTPIAVLSPSQRITSADVYPNPINVVFVGFGLDQNGQSGVKLTITLPLASACFGPEDCPLNDATGETGWVTEKGLGVINSPGGPCFGDSGGPGLVDRGGTEYVAWVNSYVSNDQCTGSTVGSAVDGHWTFIQNFMGTTYEVCEGGLDEDGDGAVDCLDTDCQADTSCLPVQWTTATTVCDTASPTCDDNSQCIEASDFPNWPAGAGICAPKCSQPFTPNETCYEGVPGFGICDLRIESDFHCILVCGSVLAEGCPDGFTCRDFTTGAADPIFGACYPNHPPAEHSCGDTLDNDEDGLTDCDDPDCQKRPPCVPPEVCDNKVDDDLDDLVDCQDSDCANEPNCQNQCESGPCCDKSGTPYVFLPDSTVCLSSIDKQTRCADKNGVWGDGCGRILMESHSDQYCLGYARECTGELLESGWETERECAELEYCDSVKGCIPDESCRAKIVGAGGISCDCQTTGEQPVHFFVLVGLGLVRLAGKRRVTMQDP